MELVKLFLIGLTYLGVTLFLGRFLLSLLKVDLKYEALNYATGYLLIEGISFLTFVFSGLMGYKMFVLSFIPAFLLLLIFIVLLMKSRKSLISFSTRSFRVLWCPSLLVFTVITVLYFINAHEQFLAVLYYNGIIYQDIAYHGSIAQSMLNFGYPVVDLQYLGKTLNYHLFTHFLTAKISFISFTNPLLSYHVFLNFLGVLFYSFLSVSLVRTLLKSKTYIKKNYNLWISAICLAAFLCTFVLGGVLNYAYISAFYFSASFQWQLFIIIVYFLVLRHVISNKEYSNKNTFLLLILLFVATVTKVSSLPLIYSGILALLIYSFIYWKKKERIFWGRLSLLSGIIAIWIYWGFFRGVKSEGSLLGFNFDLAESTPIVAFIDFSNPVLIFTIYFITVLSFRLFLIWKVKEFETWFSGGVLISGLVLSLFFKENQVYFLFPSIVAGSHVALVYLAGLRKQRLLIIPALALLVLSFYPVGGLGTFIDDQLEDREDYFPMTQERAKLYHWLKNNTAINDVIFTTSLWATPDGMPDNFYPAAMTGRKFYLGGYRFGGVENQLEFSKRLQQAKTFDIDDTELWKELRKKNINYILIEKKGNFDISIYKQVQDFQKNKHYRTLYRNDCGIILKVLQEEA